MAMRNEVVGIDTDFVPHGLRPGEYLAMIRQSPGVRTLKTIGRKLLARDARANAALRRKLSVKRLPRPDIRRMGATQMSFPDGSFSCVCSWSVFEHIDDPDRALREVVRVLRPGGVIYISVHLYTSHSGQHDASIFAAGQARAPYWPHLRAAHEHTVRETTFLNRLRLADWRTLFEARMPGVAFVVERDGEVLADALRELRSSGELSGYTDDELMTVNLVAIWKKPS
jgi:SAM-dependent methyltransferase